jgi:hypothetical protein
VVETGPQLYEVDSAEKSYPRVKSNEPVIEVYATHPGKAIKGIESCRHLSSKINLWILAVPHEKLMMPAPAHQMKWVQMQIQVQLQQ